MSSLNDSIDALIENIQVSEHYAESQRKQLHNMENEIAEIKDEITSMRNEKQKNTVEIEGITSDLNAKEALLLSLEKEIKILTDIQREMKELYENESKILNEKQQQVWIERKYFCDQLRLFSEEWGPLGTSWLREAENSRLEKIKFQPELKGEEYLLDQDVKKLEADIIDAKKQLFGAEQNLKNMQFRKEQLSSDPECGEEFIHLQAQLRQAQMEVENLESQRELARENQWCQQLLSKKLRQQTINFEPRTNSTSLVLSQQDLVNPSISDKNLGREDSYKPFQNDTHSANENAQNFSTKLQRELKRPIAAIAPAIENCSNFEKVAEDQSMPSRSKQPCPFIPKKPTSVCTRLLSRSSGWMQLESELSALLQKDFRNDPKQGK